MQSKNVLTTFAIDIYMICVVAGDTITYTTDIHIYVHIVRTDRKMFDDFVFDRLNKFSNRMYSFFFS